LPRGIAIRTIEPVKLFQIPFSHNCVKVRRALDLKGLPYETVNINPALRGDVKRASGQTFVPALVDGERSVADSTAILLYLEERYPRPALLPEEPEPRAECLILESWADAAFMKLTRRLAYWRVISSPQALGVLFFPRAPAPARRAAGSFARQVLMRRLGMSAERNRLDELEAPRAAAVAVTRLGGREHLVCDRVTIADIALASMAAPLQFAARSVREHQAVQDLLRWVRTILDVEREFAGARAVQPQAA
jgi:glutathione S-transferase